jgi:hypothetical protein
MWIGRVNNRISMNKVQRGDAILQKIANAGVIKDSSVSFLKQALDPFHDTQLPRLSGWPDANTAPSVVRCVKQSQVFSLPTGTGLTSWDLHIGNWPWVSATPYAAAIFPRNNDVVGASTNSLTDYSTTGAVLGGVQAWYTAPGANLQPLSSPNLIGTLDLGLGFTQGSSRIIGCGIECIDVTNELHKQGQVGVYRLAEPQNERYAFQYGGSATSSGPVAEIVRTFPTNFKNLMLIPGSRQWEAKDGCMIVVPFHSEDNPARIPNYVQQIIPYDGTVEDHISWSSTSGNLGQNVGLVGVPAITDLFGTAQWPATHIQSVPAFFTTPQHQCGAIFSGLDVSAQIATTVIYYIEEFPGFAQSDLLTLATPSSSYDPVAMELLTHSFLTLPVGVPAGMNGLGDWFAMAVRAAGSVIAPVALALGQPHIAALAGGAASVADQYLTAPSSMPKPQAFVQQMPRVQVVQGVAKSSGKMAQPVSFTVSQRKATGAPPLPARDASYQLLAQDLKRERNRRKKQRKRNLAAERAVLTGRRR